MRVLLTDAGFPAVRLIFFHIMLFSDLEKLVKESCVKKKIIITEGIFSMDGDSSNLKEISKISKENNCFLIVDDAHGDFVVGNNNLKNYSGTPAFFNVTKD